MYCRSSVLNWGHCMYARFHIYAIGTEECERTIAQSAINTNKDQWEEYLKGALGPMYHPVKSHTLQVREHDASCHAVPRRLVSLLCVMLGYSLDGIRAQGNPPTSLRHPVWRRGHWARQQVRIVIFPPLTPPMTHYSASDWATKERSESV